MSFRTKVKWRNTDMIGESGSWLVQEIPCKGCTAESGRSATCHGACERYLEWSKQKKERQEIVRADSARHGRLDEMERNRKVRIWKKNAKKNKSKK